ncbi:hypothetical protein OH492_27190 [Vibrio chagasii]|nr:hypothetical protein [Vibrio chagasii]
MAELKSKFKHHTQSLVLECGGNNRNNFYQALKAISGTMQACTARSGQVCCSVMC